MLVSSIGYLDTASKNSYNVDSKNNMPSSIKLGEVFGHYRLNEMNSPKSSLFDRFLNTINSLFSAKPSNGQKYLDFMA